MSSNARIVGFVLIGLGVAICVVAAALMGVGVATDGMGIPGAALGMVVFGFLPLIALAGIGSYLVWKGRKDEAEIAAIRKKERLLGLIQTQGQASVGPIMMELDMTRSEVTNAIYELVAMELFSGYIDWDAMTFYSRDASAVGSNQCPNCGGVRELVGKGVVKCPYCGVSLFVPPSAEQTRAEPRPPATPVE